MWRHVASAWTSSQKSSQVPFERGRKKNYHCFVFILLFFRIALAFVVFFSFFLLDILSQTLNTRPVFSVVRRRVSSLFGQEWNRMLTWKWVRTRYLHVFFMSVCPWRVKCCGRKMSFSWRVFLFNTLMQSKISLSWWKRVKVEPPPPAMILSRYRTSPSIPIKLGLSGSYSCIKIRCPPKLLFQIY